MVSAGFLCCCRHESTSESSSETKHKKSSKQPRNQLNYALIFDFV